MTGALGPPGHFTTARVDWLGLHPRSAQLVAAWAETGRGGADGSFGKGQLNCYAGVQVPGYPGAPGYPVTVTARQPWPMLDYWWTRSEERRVGKECTSWCRSRWSPDH